MPLYRVDTAVDGDLVELALGVVTPTGVDFGDGPVSVSIHVRLHDLRIIGYAVEVDPTHARVHELVIAGNQTATHVLLHEVTVFGLGIDLPPTHARAHHMVTVGLPA